ncbi:MAG: tRNA epoxyqueuosine(34) reductase QueG [Rhodospirillaceae bacterium]|nr:tRNA epoxyqueuosine(34) reductase QueG [Rhodospirillaceae bacterium]|tara:strand:- start:4027 stop:5190 length:1164 start_codon:yes stop_codon:yes gene_type:complete
MTSIPPDSIDPTEAIRDRALAVGFDVVGFAPAELGSDARNRLSEFVSNGYHGDMGWLSDRMKQRSQPTDLWPEAKTVIVVGLNYGPDEDPLEIHEKPERGAISVYARGRDYHDVSKKKLRILARYIADNFEGDVKLFVDTAPVMEKPLAAKAGLGWQGKHTNLVSKTNGSWLFLGEIYTTLRLETNEEENNKCGNCSQCISACPTDAFLAPYQLDARRCISYLTIEHKGHIPGEFREAIGNRIYGCDDCLAVCPWNKFAVKTNEPELDARLELRWPRLDDLVQLDNAAFRSVFSGSPVKRLGRNRFLRNVLVAIGNSRSEEFIPHAKAKLEDESPLVRAMAVWALSRLAPAEEFGKIAKRHATKEADPDVLREWRTASKSRETVPAL